MTGRGRGSRPRALALAGVLTMALASCGSGGGVDDDDLGIGGSDPSTTAPDGRAASTTAGGGEGILSADEELAQAINLVLTDFPIDEAWTREPGAGHSDSAEADQSFAECLGQEYDPANRSAELDSDAFVGPAGIRVSSTVLIRVEEAGAEESFRTLEGDHAPGCVKDSLDEQVRSQTQQTPSNSTVERLEFADIGDSAVGFRYRTGGNNGLVVDSVFVRVGRISFNAGFVGQGTQPPFELERELMTKMASRAEA